MALWMVRTGKYGEHEQKFLDDSRCYLTWDGTDDIDLSSSKNYEGIKELLGILYPDTKPKTRINWASQIAAFVFEIKKGDWIVVPRRTTPAIAFAEVLSSYEFDPTAIPPYRHSIKVKWLTTDVPRTAFDQDILYSLGAFMTVCRIAKNDAEARIKAMAQAGWKAAITSKPIVHSTSGQLPGPTDSVEEDFDIEQSAMDQIRKRIQAKFKGHGMGRLVAAVLRAQGFKTHLSPPGPDGGIDILASPGTFGFAEPRICVQVKSQQTPIERTVLDALGGVMKKVSATHGLLVSWAGFKSSITKEEAQQFFHVRLWDADKLIQELLAVYDKLDADTRAELPLKQVWTLTTPDEP